MSVNLTTEEKQHLNKLWIDLHNAFTQEEIDKSLEVDDKMIHFIKTEIRPRINEELYGMKQPKQTVKEPQYANFVG